MGKLVITGWSAVLRCNSCGHEQESRQYGTWEIDSATISPCERCGKVTAHTIVRKIAETLDYVDLLKDHKATLPLDG